MLTNIRLLLSACEALEIKSENFHPTRNLVKVTLNDKDYFFTNYSTPFLTQSTGQLFKDKDYVYHVFKNFVNLPKTLSFLSPYCHEKYQPYLIFKDIDSIVEEIARHFSPPLIVKKNGGSGGDNVFLCQDLSQVRVCLEEIFNINSRLYDYVALAQEYINIDREYRAVIFKNELLLLYEKSTKNATFTGNLSPLHWEGAKAIHITDEQEIFPFKKFLQPIFQAMTIDYGGFDIAIDKTGNYWFIEVNSHPNFDIFIRDNDEGIIIEMFKKILKSYLEM
ncbi:RimK domain protein ATP-grasp [Gloeothece citriformis PCC 7424]|uniref:RimK domain protein ATP-grasp n=1 Tax=Gloeothece citriformis (strain PCC 7424) TaxID=65393 RepID=B7KDC9_GLOC7|nr:YheC/YheD family protein [Gloeothece citriformis]ACK68949.1 RimK domain protein ATP-grasp [Gloeothece citriformis PCC 7424]